MILNLFTGIKVKKTEDVYSVHKPLLLLIALARCFHGKERMASFISYEDEIYSFRKYFGELPVQYPFGRLVSDRLWEIERYDELTKNSSGDLLKSELIQKDIKGGFPLDVFCALSSDNKLLLKIVDLLLWIYFPSNKYEELRAILKLPRVNNEKNTKGTSISYGVKQNMGALDELELPLEIAEQNCKTNNVSRDSSYIIGPEMEKNKDQLNGYISYLNSLHNLSASGSNALAESQALNSYFDEIYVAFPLAKTVKEALISGEEKVIVLTGHAGDGKSTVALDVFKYLIGHAPDRPLQHQLKELEEVSANGRKISIVKDMSELGAKERVSWLDSAFGKSGSWLIISNTGPLLNSLSDFVKEYHIITDSNWLENEVLKKLDTPYQGADLAAHTLQLAEGHKPLIIFNMTRLNNVDLGAKVLEKMLLHSGWSGCQGCDVESDCPLRKNRQALQQENIIDRVRWVYQRITAYEQRLTLRQIVAHLAYSITGGLDCSNARNYAYDVQASNGEVDTGLENILFSENFFGYKNGEVFEKAENLKAVELIRRLEFGSPFAVDFERKLIAEDDTSWVGLPTSLTAVAKRWRNYSRDAAGIRWRFALRRMAYFYGQPISQQEQSGFESFLDNFLQSPKLRQFDHWQRKGTLDLSLSEKRTFKNNILDVLREVYSGFSAGQFKGSNSNSRLYLTLRRPDKTVAQPVQMVMASFNNNDFSMGYDLHLQLPFLSYRDAKLMLSLPLLDYIQMCSIGSLGNQLVPIHLAQLEWFRAKLLRIAEQDATGYEEFTVLSAGIDGTIKINSYYIDKGNNTLEFI